jgi:hypothetical protein
MAETQTPLSLPIINQLTSNFVGFHHISFKTFLTFNILICAFRLRTFAAKTLNDGAQTKHCSSAQLPQKLQDRKSATKSQLQQAVEMHSATELSFRKIAKIVGVHRCAVSNFGNGQFSPREIVLSGLCSIYF